MDQLEMKKLAAQAALEYVKADTIVGVGSGSTVNCFIEALGTIKIKFKAQLRLQKHQKNYYVNKGSKYLMQMMSLA